MEDFYEIFTLKKKNKAFKIKDIAVVLKKPYNTVRMAIDRKSLTELEKHTIAHHFDFYGKESEPPVVAKVDESGLTDEIVVKYIIEHSDRLRETSNEFKMFCELLEVRAEREIMRRLRE